MRIHNTIGGAPIVFDYVDNRRTANQLRRFIEQSAWLAIDTESTGINCYHRGWKLRTVQVGTAFHSFVIPAKQRKIITWLTQQPINWIGHNGTHDWRSIDCYLGYDSGNQCVGETYIPAHHDDSRNRMEGGVGHSLKELACVYVAPDAGKWEIALKAAFKELTIPIPGQVYKSGPRKGQPKVRKAKLSEGWRLIPDNHPAYIAYAAADPILTYRLWTYLRPVVRRYKELYKFDMQVDRACDTLQRRAIRLDVPYTQRLSAAYEAVADTAMGVAASFGCHNINSTAQIADALSAMGISLTARTPTGKFKVDDHILRGILAKKTTSPHVAEFIHAVLTAKQVLKRKAAYADAMLEEMDEDCRVHPSINSLAARTARMSVSNPALHQLPTKSREDDLV